MLLKCVQCNSQKYNIYVLKYTSEVKINTVYVTIKKIIYI